MGEITGFRFLLGLQGYACSAWAVGMTLLACSTRALFYEVGGSGNADLRAGVAAILLE